MSIEKVKKRPYLMVAPNGARRQKTDHPQLPLTVAELVKTANNCYRAGAEAIHLHVRDVLGKHTLDAGLYTEAMTEIERVVPEMAIQITTESAGIFDVSAQFECLQLLKPLWASISVREIARDEKRCPAVYALCAEQDTRVQHILYDVDDVQLLLDWQARGIVSASQNSVLFVLGRYAQRQMSTPADLMTFRRALPNHTDWMVCAFGPYEHACLLEGARQGGAIRVGFENSLVTENGTLHANNTASVTALIKALEAL